VKLKKPSPKVLAFLVIVVILITTTIVSSKFLDKGFFGKGSESNKNSQISLTIKNNLSRPLEQKDSDSDGLPDWQEEIWKTDKNNPDTDSDGTTDGQEVKDGRNPAVAGPDDKILNDEEAASKVITESLSKKSTDPNSVTSILSKNLLLRLAQLQQSQQYTTESGDALAKDLVDQTVSEVQIPEKYPENIFLTFDSTNKQKLQEYSDKMISIQSTELSKGNTDSTNLDPVINSFKSIAFQMSVMGVPEDLLSVHAKITNGYYLAAEALINLKLSDSDPILGILSIPVYKKVSEEQPILYQQVQNYLESSGIIFNIN